jgi:hypothetical protein
VENLKDGVLKPFGKRIFGPEEAMRKKKSGGFGGKRRIFFI